MSETPCFTVFSGGRPLNLGGETIAPKLWGVWADRAWLSRGGTTDTSLKAAAFPTCIPRRAHTFGWDTASRKAQTGNPRTSGLKRCLPQSPQRSLANVFSLPPWSRNLERPLAKSSENLFNSCSWRIRASLTGHTIPTAIIQYIEFSARPLCRNVSGIFVVQILEDFAGDFPGGFSWALFPTKMQRKNPATKSAKKSGGLNKNPRKFRSAKTRP